MTQDIQKFTDQLIELLKLDVDPNPDENKFYLLDLDDGLSVRYTDLNPGVYLVSTLGPLAQKNRETTLVSLMHLNLFGNGTGGAVIGYDEEINLLTFSQAVAYRVEFEEFKNILEDFINYVDYWRKELKKAELDQKSILTSIS